MRLRVGIIGAGVSGLTLARRLHDGGCAVTVLDKGRRPGGRASTRESSGLALDHGCSSVTVRDPAFRAFLDEHLPPGVVVPWLGSMARLEGDRLVPEPDPDPDPALSPRLVGVPGMASICGAMASGIDVRNGIRVERISRSEDGWRVIDGEGIDRGPFDWVVSTAPPPQSIRLLKGLGTLSEAMASVVMLPCFSLMIALRPGAPGLPFDGIRCDHPVLSWASNEHRKPGRPPDPAVVIQSNHQWAEVHRADDPAAVSLALKASAAEALGLDPEGTRFESLHRWLFASPDRPIGVPCLVDPDLRLAACGDWCISGDVEGAFRSGDSCSRIILDAS